MEKQRTEYEKYLIGIRYYNEQHKLKLLDKIEKLQSELDQQKSLDSSFQSIKDSIGDNTTTEKLINTITDLNENLTNAKLEFQEEKLKLLTLKEELERKLALANQKAQKLSKKSKEQSNRIHTLSTARAQILSRCNTEKMSNGVSQVLNSPRNFKPETKKLENIITNLKHDLAISKNETLKEKDLRKRLYQENVSLKSRIQELIKSDRKNIK